MTTKLFFWRGDLIRPLHVQKNKVKDHLIQKTELKQMDGCSFIAFVANTAVNSNIRCNFKYSLAVATGLS